MSLITESAAFAAAHLLYADAFMSEFDQAGGQILSGALGPNGVPGEKWVRGLSHSRHAPHIFRLIGRLEQAWGYDPGLVFHHLWEKLGKFNPEYRTRFADFDAFVTHCLYYCLMQAKGHGIGLLDDEEMGEAWDRVWSKVFNSDAKPAPFTIDDPWADLARQQVENRIGCDPAYAVYPESSPA